jgi:mono/diheme cytochrome c family protein
MSGAMTRECKGCEERKDLACWPPVDLFVAILAVFAFLTVANAAAQTQPPSAPPAGNAQAGKDLYLRYSCYACHGYDGHGGAGARLVPMRMTVERFTAYVHSPRQMPPYTTKLLSDAQLADLFAYIKSLPVSPEAKDIPLLARIMSGK